MTPRLWYRIQMAGHGTDAGPYPLGILPEHHAKGWGPIWSRVMASGVKRLVIANPYGDESGPNKPMRLDCYDRLAAVIPGSLLLDRATFADWADDFINDGGELVLYLGGSIGPGVHSLGRWSEAYWRALSLIPRRAIPCVDYLGETREFGQCAAESIRAMGFARIGYECSEFEGYPIGRAGDVCYVTGDWWSKWRHAVGRTSYRLAGYEVLCQAEPPFDTVAQVAARLVEGVSPVVELHRRAEYLTLAGPTD